MLSKFFEFGFNFIKIIQTVTNKDAECLIGFQPKAIGASVNPLQLFVSPALILPQSRIE